MESAVVPNKHQCWEHIVIRAQEGDDFCVRANTNASACVWLACVAFLALPASPGAAADKVRWYETRGVVVNTAALADWTRNSYWRAKLLQQVELTLFRGGPGDEAGQNALLSAVSAWISAAVPEQDAEQVLLVEHGGAAAPQIAARVKLVAAEGRPQLELEPLLIDKTITSRVENEAASAWRPRSAFLHSRFPGGIEAFCSSKTDICAVLFQQLEQLLPQPGSYLVIVSDAAAQYTFHALIQDTADPAKRLTVRYLADAGILAIGTPAGYETKDAIDLDLERLQDPVRTDRLGKLSGLEDLSREKRTAVKYATLVYFESGTRDAEADIAWPVRGADKALYTLKVLPYSNDVRVEAIGTVKQLTRCDLRRSPGFPERAPIAAVREWLHRRYPAIHPSGETPGEFIANAQALIDAQAGDPKWFSRNYRLAILDPKAADRRLSDTHRMPPNRRSGLKQFSGEELHTLECVLETMGDRILQRIRDTALIRQAATEETSPFGELGKQVPIAGHTFSSTSVPVGPDRHREVHCTIVIYDAALAPPTRFIGGRAPDGRVYAYAPVAQVVAHEFGHVVAQRASLGHRFYEWVAELNIPPFTRYAASAPQGEFFPEAFALYLLDPWWLQANYPTLYARARGYAGRPPDH
jgi:hypothetical protein